MRENQALGENVRNQLQLLCGLPAEKDVAGKIDVLVGVGPDQQPHIVPFWNQESSSDQRVNEAMKLSIAAVFVPKMTTTP